MNDERQFLLQHAAHDYDALTARWRVVAENARLTMETVANSGDYPVFGLKSADSRGDGGGFYVSAGIHGDEPAATVGLVQWAEANAEFLAARPCVIFPCLNPWGLIHNRRHNADGEDLNRCFGDLAHPLIGAWRQFLGESRFAVGVCLHEDYDARGCYVYELSPPGRSVGERGLDAVEAIVPRQPDGDIEGRPAQSALIRHDGDFGELADELREVEGGLPEAVQLALDCVPVSLTFETPSEYSLFDRVRAQERFLEAIVVG